MYKEIKDWQPHLLNYSDDFLLQTRPYITSYTGKPFMNISTVPVPDFPNSDKEKWIKKVFVWLGEFINVPISFIDGLKKFNFVLNSNKRHPQFHWFSRRWGLAFKLFKGHMNIEMVLRNFINFRFELSFCRTTVYKWTWKKWQKSFQSKLVCSTWYKYHHSINWINQGIYSWILRGRRGVVQNYWFNI